MARRLVISLFMLVALVASSTEIRAAAGQSLHFPVAAPPEAPPSTDDIRIGIKADGLPSTGSNPVNLTPGDPATLVTSKAAQGACKAAWAKASCSRITQGGCVGPDTCCDEFLTAPGGVLVDCFGAAGDGFELNRPGAATAFFLTALGAGGSITHLSADGKTYPALGVDIGARALLQVRPNGVLGNVELRIFHTQGGANPRIAIVTVNSTNDEPTEAQALHNGIETALEAIALPVPIVATTRPYLDAASPLSAFTYFKQATHFTEISNINAAGITEVLVVGLTGQSVTIEGSDNTIDSFGPPAVPTLNTWGIVALVIMLVLAGYVLKRRQMAGTATS